MSWKSCRDCKHWLPDEARCELGHVKNFMESVPYALRCVDYSFKPQPVVKHNRRTVYLLESRTSRQGGDPEFLAFSSMTQALEYAEQEMKELDEGEKEIARQCLRNGMLHSFPQGDSRVYLRLREIELDRID